MRIHYDVGDKVAGLGAYGGASFTLTDLLPHGAFAEGTGGERLFLSYGDIEASSETRRNARVVRYTAGVNDLIPLAGRLTEQQLAQCCDWARQQIEQQPQSSKERVGER